MPELPPCEFRRTADPHLKHLTCDVASQLAGLRVPLEDPRACRVCCEQAEPKAPNHVTASLAIFYQPTTPEKNAKAKQLSRYILHEARSGPGYELSKILRAFGIKPDKGCVCFEHAQEMNRNGIEWCRRNKRVIAGWLKEEADERGFAWIFSRMGARPMVELALLRYKFNPNNAETND